MSLRYSMIIAEVMSAQHCYCQYKYSNFCMLYIRHHFNLKGSHLTDLSTVSCSEKGVMLNQLGMNQKQARLVLKIIIIPFLFLQSQPKLLQNKLKHYLCPTFLVLGLNAAVLLKLNESIYLLISWRNSRRT